MPFHISRSYLDANLAKAPRVGASRKLGLNKGEKGGSGLKAPKVKRLFGGAITGGTAFGLGYLEGKMGMPKVGPFSADVIGAAALHTFLFFAPQVVGEYGFAVEGIANGALSYWAGVQGALLAGISRNAPPPPAKRLDWGGKDNKGTEPGAAILGEYGGQPMSPAQQWSTQFR